VSPPSSGGGITIIGEGDWSGTPPTSIIYAAVGPSQWNLRYPGPPVGPYSLRGSDGSYLGGTVVQVKGVGTFRLPGSIIVLDNYGRSYTVPAPMFWAYPWTTGMGQSVEVTVQGTTPNGQTVSATMITVIVS
jgi:hypothetical protein